MSSFPHVASLSRTTRPTRLRREHHVLRTGCRQARRTFITLPDLSSFSPFNQKSSNEGSGSGGGPEGSSDGQTYHERKILPYSRRELYNIIADMSSYPRFVPFCSSTRTLRTSTSTSSSTLSSQAHHTSLSHTSRSKSLAEHLSKPTLDLLSSKEVLELDVEMTAKFLVHEESYVSVVTCRPFKSVTAVASSSTPLFKSLTTTWRFQPASPTSPHPSNSSTLLSPPSSSLSPRSIGSPESEAAEVEKAPTLITLDLAYAFANPVHAALSKAFFGQVSKAMVRAFEERCLEVYGRGRR